MRFANLAEWLAWQETLHPSAVDLGLARVRAVAGRLGWGPLPFPVISVAGTNGKGSTVAFLTAVLEAAGYRVGAYTSPHLLRYNERVRVAGAPAPDEALCQAFERIDRARGELSLTYFEFGTLAALDLFRQASLDALVLEVGLGGRLDAVNLVDADVAIVTTVDLDHTEWLGPDRESVGREKAGILRRGRPAVCGDPHPPASLLAVAAGLGAPLYRIGRDYDLVEQDGRWDARLGEEWLTGLPPPRLAGRAQLRNAATALMALRTLAERLPVSRAALEQGVRRAALPGRLQVLPGAVERILDVAHNPQAARELAAFLQSRPCAGRTHALVGMLSDKDVVGVLREVVPWVDSWRLASLGGPRGGRAEDLAQALAGLTVAPVTTWPDPASAYRDLLRATRPPDRVVVFGSFLTVGPALRIENSAWSPETHADG